MPILLLLLCLAFQAVSFSQSSTTSMEIVESIPIETNLDNPDIRNATEVWLEMINNTKRTLDIEQFYISPQKGEALDSVLRAIEKAAARGVQVRVIIDARMYKTYPETVDKWRALNTSDVRAGMFPEARIIDFGKIAGGIQHAKFFIVDQEEIFIGSQNFDWRALQHIHELGIRLKHKEAVAMYNDIFSLDWQYAATTDSAMLKAPVPQKQYPSTYFMLSDVNDTIAFTTTASPKSCIPDTSLWDESNMVALINGAKSEVNLQFLAYSSRARDKSYYAVIQDALKAAAARGIKVKMIVSDWEKDHPNVDSLQQLSTIPNIELKYSVIPDWSGGYIPYGRVEHCKYIIVDGSSFWLGTSNCEKSYFHTSRNLGIIVRNTTLAGKMQHIFLKSWNGSYVEPITINGTYEVREHGEKKQ